MSTTPAIAIRRAETEEAPRIRELVRAAYAKYVGRIGREPAPMTADYRALVGEGRVWVGLIDASIVGLVVLDEHAESLELDNIAVSPSLQGQGVGRQLLAFVEQRGRALGKGTVTLYTHELMTENIALYTRIGYVEVGRREVDRFKRVFFEKTLRDTP